MINVMSVVKGEKHVFTNNSSYMTTFEKMKYHVKRQQDPESKLEDCKVRVKLKKKN